jgi:hypothetical protein
MVAIFGDEGSRHSSELHPPILHSEEFWGVIEGDMGTVFWFGNDGEE